MPVLNSPSVKAGNPISPNQRALKEPKESSFDLQLTASIEESDDVSKESSLAETDASGAPEMVGIAPPEALVPGLPTMAPSGTIPDNILTTATSNQHPLNGNDVEKSAPSPGAAVALTITTSNVSNPIDAPSALPVMDGQTTKVGLPSGSPKAPGKPEIKTPVELLPESKAPFQQLNDAGIPPLSVANDASTTPLHRSSGTIAATAELKPSNAKAKDDLIAALTSTTTESAPHADIVESSRSVSALAMPPNLGFDLTVIPSTKTTEPISIESAIGSRQWSEEVSQTVHLLIKQNQQLAEIRLNPPEMGPIEIQISMTHGEATISFAADHTETRNALEFAIPRLKEMLAENGISLAGTFVGGESRQPQHSAQSRLKAFSSASGQAPHTPLENVDISITGMPRKSSIDVYV